MSFSRLHVNLKVNCESRQRTGFVSASAAS